MNPFKPVNPKIPATTPPIIDKNVRLHKRQAKEILNMALLLLQTILEVGFLPSPFHSFSNNTVCVYIYKYYTREAFPQIELYNSNNNQPK